MIISWNRGHGYRSTGVVFTYGAGIAAVVSQPRNIFGAIRARVESISDFTDILLGGIWQHEADADAWDNPPYAVVNDVGGDRMRSTTHDKYISRRRMQVQFFGTTHDQVADLANLWEDNFHAGMDRLAVERSNGYVVVSDEPRFLEDCGMTPSGAKLVGTIIEFWAFASRS